MSLKRRIKDIQWTINREWFGVWEVRDYYTKLEQRAQAGSKFTIGYVLMIITAAILATAGLLLNNPAVVIGSMCVAPFLGPSRAVCIGGLFRNRKIFLGALLKQLFGLLLIGAGTAYLFTSLMEMIVPGIAITPEILLRAMPTPKDVVLTAVVAITAGSAASLALSADPRIVETPWGQVLDAMIGVEIAISLIPPASVVGIGLAFARTDISWNAMLLLLMNVVGLDFIGSMGMMAIRGIRAKYLTVEKTIHWTAESALFGLPATAPINSTIHVTLLSEKVAQVLLLLRCQNIESIPDNLAQIIATSIRDATGCRSEVTVELIPSQTFATLQIEGVL